MKTPAAQFLLSALVLQGALAAEPEVKFDHYLPSKWNTVGWGVYGADIPPVLRVKSGDTVKIDVANPFGVNRADPKRFFLDHGIPLDLPVVQDILEICEKTPYDATGLRGALLTGPIHVEGAAPGDTLEVRIHDIRVRAPYGVNSVGISGSHPLSDVVPRPWSKKFDFDFEKNVAIFQPGAIEIPLSPFMGQMGVAPPAAAGRFGAGPPTNIHGGNFDLQELTRGSTLYLPVNVDGALFFTGNGHALQGNGEINGPAIETSLTGYFQFIVHKHKKLAAPWAETPTHYLFFGLNDSLDECTREAGRQTVQFLQERFGFDFYDAYALTSTSVDFAVSRALVPMQMVFSYVPKHIFTPPARYWYQGQPPVRY